MNKSILIAAALVLAIFGLVAAPAMAQEEAAIKHRKSVMKVIGGHMGAIAGIIKGKAKYPNGIQIHTRAMADLSKVIAHVFPKGSDFGKTRAKEEIWSKPAEFKKAVMKFQMEAAKLAKAAAGGDMKAAGAAFKGFGKAACGSCHKTFRAKKKKSPKSYI